MLLMGAGRQAVLKMLKTSLPNKDNFSQFGFSSNKFIVGVDTASVGGAGMIQFSRRLV